MGRCAAGAAPGGEGVKTLSDKEAIEDSQKALWIGTTGGLSRYKDGRITSFGARQGLTDDVVFSLVEDGAGFFWLGGNRGISRVSKAGALSRCREGETLDVSASYHRDAWQLLQKIVADEQYIVRFPGAANSFVMSWPAVRNVEVYTGDLMGINEWIDPTKAPIAKS